MPSPLDALGTALAVPGLGRGPGRFRTPPFQAPPRQQRPGQPGVSPGPQSDDLVMAPSVGSGVGAAPATNPAESDPVQPQTTDVSAQTGEPDLNTPYVDWGKTSSRIAQRGIEDLSNAPAPATGARKAFGTALDVLGAFTQWPGLSYAAGKLKYPGLDQYDANVARRQAESDIATRQAQTQATIDNQRALRQEALQRMAQSDQNNKRSAYVRQQNELDKAKAFSQPDIPAELTTYPMGGTQPDASNPPAADMAAGAPITNLPTTQRTLSPGLPAERQLAEPVPGEPAQPVSQLGSVRRITDPDTKETSTFVVPNPATRQAMETQEATPEMVQMYGLQPGQRLDKTTYAALLKNLATKKTPKEADRVLDARVRTIANKNKISLDETKPLLEQLPPALQAQATTAPESADVAETRKLNRTATQLMIDERQQKLDDLKAATGPDAVQGGIDLVTKDPAAYWSLEKPLQSKVKAALQKQGLPVPIQKPNKQLEDQAASATLALSHIQNVRNMLADPWIAKNVVGPAEGRISKGEQLIGMNVPGATPEQTQKAQNFLSSLNYLFFREGRALLSGRPPEKLMTELKKTSPRPEMAPSRMKGAMDATQQAAQMAIQAHQNWIYGSAGGGTGAPAPGGPAAGGGNVVDRLLKKYGGPTNGGR